MGLFINPLVDAGYRVIAFDAPAHGDSGGKRTSLLEFAQIVHDEDDAEIPYHQALRLSEKWPESQLITTRGLGHRRILKDKETISRIVSFVENQREDNILRNTENSNR
jgi:pimeloyl-ACP methyl ester carboxylesterase